MNRSTEIATLLRKASNNNASYVEKSEFIRQAEELKAADYIEKNASSTWDAKNAVIGEDHLVPASVHELHTASTDWIMDVDIPTFDEKTASHKMIAEASLWYGRVDDDVKSYGEEYAEQARNLARKLSGSFGDSADAAERAFIDEAQRLRSTALRAGLVVEADLATGASSDPEPSAPSEEDQPTAGSQPGGMSAMSSLASDDLYSSIVSEAASSLPEVGQDGYPTDVFSNLSQNGNIPPEATSSNRAPALQELSDTSGDVVPVNDPGLGQTNDLTGQNSPRTGEQDHASKGSFPVSGNKKESSMASAQCPTCGGHGRVAVRAKTAASGLPQIDQIVDPHDSPAATPYPSDVAFPWTLNPSQQVPATIQQAEQQIADRSSKSPLQPNSRQSVESRRIQAGGRDNSGWIGDNGARGLDYPGEQVGQSPVPDSSDGYQDPVYRSGGDNGNQPNKPYGAMEDNDYTNDQDQNWQPGQPTQMDTGWQSVVQSDPNLSAAAAYLAQAKQAYVRSGR